MMRKSSLTFEIYKLESLTLDQQIQQMQMVDHDVFSNQQMQSFRNDKINLQYLWFEYLVVDYPHRYDILMVTLLIVVSMMMMILLQKKSVT